MVRSAKSLGDLIAMRLSLRCWKRSFEIEVCLVRHWCHEGGLKGVLL